LVKKAASWKLVTLYAIFRIQFLLYTTVKWS